MQLVTTASDRVSSGDMEPITTSEELAAVCGDFYLQRWDLATREVCHASPVAEHQAGFDLAYLGADRLVFSGADLIEYALGTGAVAVISQGCPWGRRIKVAPDGKHLVEVDQTRSTDRAGSGLLVREMDEWELQPG